MKRNYGIDLMRIVSMFYVIVLHTLGQGGVLNTVKAGSIQFDIAWFLEIWAYCAVDVFALISGYVGYREKEKPVKYASYIELWFQVVAYGLATSFAVFLIRPDLVTIHDFIHVSFPVKNGLYWYFSAYTGLILVVPLLDYAITKAPERVLRKLFVVFLLMFSVFETYTERFATEGGYSFVWLVLLYLMGSMIHKCSIGKNLSVGHSFALIILLEVVTWLFKIINWQGLISLNITGDALISYTSPTILGVAILYLIGASKLKIDGKMAKIVEFGASSAFAAYILNCQNFIWNYGMKDRFAFMSSASPWVIIAVTIGFSALFVVLSILADKVRMWIFKLLHIKQLSKILDVNVRRLF